MLSFDGNVDISQIDAQIVRLIENLGPQYEDRLLRKIGGIVKRGVKKQFARGGIPGWAALAESTLERRKYGKGFGKRGSRARTSGKKPLGGAKGSFAKAIHVGIRERGLAVRIGPPKGLEKLIALHATGNRSLPGRMAYRLTPRVVKRIEEAMGNYLDRALGIRGMNRRGGGRSRGGLLGTIGGLATGGGGGGRDPITGRFI